MDRTTGRARGLGDEGAVRDRNGAGDTVGAWWGKGKSEGLVDSGEKLGHNRFIF